MPHIDRARVEEIELRRVYTLTEAARLLGCSRRTLGRYVSEGRIEPGNYARLGGRVAGPVRITGMQLLEILATWSAENLYL